MSIKPILELLPFLKELFFGESDFSRTIRRNKLALFLLVVCTAMLFLLVLVMNISLNKQQTKDLIVDENRQLKEELVSLRTQVDLCKKTPIYSETKVVAKPITKQSPKKPKEPDTPQPVTINKKLDAIRTKEDD